MFITLCQYRQAEMPLQHSRREIRSNSNAIDSNDLEMAGASYNRRSAKSGYQAILDIC